MSVKSLFSLHGKKAFISGATGYFGKEIAYALCDAGAHVILNGRNEEKLSNMELDMKSKGYSVEIAIFDITDKKSISQYFLKHTSLNILINNAYQGALGSIEYSSSQNYKDSYDISLIAASNIFTSALGSLRESAAKDGDASVINIASMYGMISPDIRIYKNKEIVNPPFYGAAKAALIQWSKYAACEFGHEGIRVNSISPGAFPNKETQSKSPDFINKLSSKIPLNRVGDAKEICAPVVFLSSSGSTYITGSNLVIDGGWTSW